MKNIITIVLVLAIGSVVGYLALDHYNNYQTKEQSSVDLEQRAKDEQTTAQINNLTAERDGAKQQTEQLRAECQKGRTIYDSLTEFNKSRFVMPECGK